MNQSLAGANRALPSFGARTVRRVDQLNDGLLVHGEGFALEVRGDGSWVRLNLVDRSLRAPAVPLEKRSSDALLEKRARAFVQKELADAVLLGRGESLEHWFTHHEIEIEGSDAGGTTRRLAASRVVFTRAIDGEAVLGPGSKVSVTLDTAGAAIGYSFDWATLVRTTEEEAPASRQQVESRRTALARLHANRPGQKVSLRRLECGYYDAGALGARDRTVRSACVAHQQVTDERGFQSVVFLDTIPAGTSIPADSDWQEAALLRSLRIE